MKAEVRRLTTAMRKLLLHAQDVKRVAHEARALTFSRAIDHELADRLRRTHDFLLVVEDDITDWTRSLESATLPQDRSGSPKAGA